MEDQLSRLKLYAKTEAIDGYTYEVMINKGVTVEGISPVDPPDPKAVYLDLWVIDEVNGITHDHQTFDLTRYCELVGAVGGPSRPHDVD